MDTLDSGKARKKRNERNERYGWWLAVAAIAAALVYLLSPILAPFLAAAVLAYIFNPLVTRMSRRMPRTLAVSIALALIAGVLLVMLLDSNLKFPTWLDKTVGLVFTTPNLHKIHHEQDQYYTDSNYADILILWDKLFGSFKFKPVAYIKLGLKEFDSPRQQTFWYAMISPFVKMKSREIEAAVVPNKKEVAA